MPLTTGQSLSFYEILGPLGAGGMGEVYRAKDTRLGREVAIKVLPEELADDDERLRRFEREAKTLASLNHPNVAGIHGVDQAGDVYFLALELVPGEDLGERLKRGPLPFEEAIDVCRQIAEGLEAAHEAGVVHRDLKPANVRVTQHGTAKLLDFGLAKPLRIEGASGATSAAESDSFLATEQGVVLGTPTYMSPEQARGKPVDRRTDIWALGCVLYECLTGRRAFGGESFTDVLAAIAGEEPDWSKLPALPERVDVLLRRMLIKDPRSRLRDAGEARVQLELASAEPRETSGSASTHASSAQRGRWWAWFAAAVALVVGVAIGTRLAPSEPDVERRVLRFEVGTLPPGTAASDYALSPDGLHVAWNDLAGLHVRALDALEMQTLVAPSPGSTRAAVHALTWSPDGKYIAYSTASELWRVSLAGGEPVRLAEGGTFSAGPNTLAWSPDDTLVTPATGGLSSVPAKGGPITLLELPELEDTMHHDGLAWSPDGHLVLVKHRTGVARPDALSVYADGELVELTTLVGWVVSSVDFTSDAIWLARELNGENSIWKLPYSHESKSLTGEPELIRTGASALSVDGRGTAVHVLEEGSPETEMVWVDLEGQIEPFGRTFDGEFTMLSLTHDGRQVVANDIGTRSSIWSYDLDRKVTAPLYEFDVLTATIGGTLPDGRLLGTSFGSLVTYAYPLDGRGEAERIVDGLVVRVSDEGSFAAVLADPMSGTPTLQSFQLGTGDEPLDIRSSISPQAGAPDISHDGRWLAFSTERNGQANVALTRFPSGEGEWPVSGDGGSSAWFEAGDTVIYFQRGGIRQGAPLEIWRVSFDSEPEVRLGAPEQLFQLEDEIELFDYHAPTQRFVGTRSRTSAVRRIVVETQVR